MPTIPPAPAPAPGTPTDSGLQPRLGLVSLTIYGVGNMLGAGIYALVGKAAGVMGNAVWMAFAASMVAAGLTGLSYASLGSRYPRAGGAAYITHRAFGWPMLAYVIGLAVMASGLTSMAAASRAFSGYFTGLIGADPRWYWAAIPTFIAILAAVNFRGIRESAWANAVCTIIEATGLLLIIAVGARYWGSIDYLDAATVANPTGELSIALILSGSVLTFYSFIGFEDLLNVSEEVKDPRRTFPIALLTALVITTFIYMAVSITAVSVVDHAALAESPEPLVDVMRNAAPWFPSVAFSAIALFAVSNTALLNYIMGSRLAYGMSRQGLLPRFLSAVHPRRHTPHTAIAILGVIVLALALSGDIGVLARATSVLLLLSFSVVNASLIVLKLRKTEPRGGFEVPIGIPAAGILVCLAMLAHAEPAPLKVAAGLLAAIVVLYFLVRPRAAHEPV